MTLAQPSNSLAGVADRNTTREFNAAGCIPVGEHKAEMRILVIEDDRKVASFIGRSLREQGYLVDLANDGDKGIDLAMRTPYEGIVLDVRLPTISGLQVCRELRIGGVQTPILMLTARSLIEHRVEGLDAGADDYLTKPFALAELHARVRALTRRGSQNRNTHLQYEDIELDRHKRRATRAGIDLNLTAKEVSLLELLMVRTPEAVTRSEIVESVWSYGFDTDSNLVEVYINRVRQKLDQDRPRKLIQTVRGIGYRLGDSE
jgi:DNA-binding response OmpR family regulator